MVTMDILQTGYAPYKGEREREKTWLTTKYVHLINDTTIKNEFPLYIDLFVDFFHCDT